MNKNQDNKVIEINGQNPESTGDAKAKTSLKDKVVQKYHKFRSTKVGKWAVRIAKGGAVVGGLYTSYRAGQKSVKPTVVTIEHDAEPEEAVEEVPAEEPAEEQTAE